MEHFVLVDAETLGRVFSRVNPTTCLLDQIPTSLLKQFYAFFEFELLNLVICSLQMGVFPTAFKTLVSNLPFLSQILEKLVYIQLKYFLNSNSILEQCQSGFRMNRSTETAFVKIVNLRCHMDSQKLSVLVLLDLSAAFDTVVLYSHPLWYCSLLVFFLPHRPSLSCKYGYMFLRNA